MSKKILVVEDDPDLGKVLAKRLIGAGLEPRLVPDGMLALKEAQGFKPDLVILDLMFPGGGGLSVLERLKLSVYTNTIPVIVVTAKEDPTYKKKITDIGVSGYYQKPYDVDRLIEHALRLIAEQPTK